VIEMDGRYFSAFTTEELAAMDANNRAADALLHRLGRNQPAEPEPEPVTERQLYARIDWDGWARGLIVEALAEYDREHIAPWVNKIVEDADQQITEIGAWLNRLQDEVEALRTENAALRADLTVTTALARGEIRELKSSKSDAAVG
jgi:hypothetical protein